MTPTYFQWRPGPPPPADGLRSAFRAADRRRARTAIAAAVPVVVALALTMTTSLQSVGTDSLQLPPAKRVPVTKMDRQLPDASTATAPKAAQQPGALARSSAAAGAPRAAAPGQPAAAPAAAPDPSPAPGGYIDVVAQRSARVQIRLPRATHPDFFRTVFDRTGHYAGVWLLNADGAVVGSALELIGPDGKRAPRYSTDLPVLP